MSSHPPHEDLSAFSSVPPPAHGLIIPSHRLTPQQLLAHHLSIPVSPLTQSCGYVPNVGMRPTPNSSQQNANHEAVIADKTILLEIPRGLIQRFRDRVKTMSSEISFADAICLPFDACPMVSKAMVAFYHDTQVLVAVWQLLLKMLPQDRDYDLELVKQVHIGEGFPDQMFAVIDPNESKPFVIIEFKAPGIVTGILPVLENLHSNLRSDPPDDWVSVTRQLRKYAVKTHVRHIIVMDDRTAIYLAFPLSAANKLERHEFLVASHDIPAREGDNPKLSLRELVLFVLLRALEERKIHLRTFGDKGATKVHVDNQGTYRSVLGGSAEASRKRSVSGTEGPSSGTRGQSKRAKTTGAAQDCLVTYNGWVVGHTVTLEMLPGMMPPRTLPRAESLDSDFHEGSSSSPLISLRKRTAIRLESSYTLTLTVQCIKARNLALVDSGAHRFVAKLFTLSKDEQTYMRRELAVYSACASLQGHEIPYLYAVAGVLDESQTTFQNHVLLTECIEPGTTVAELVQAARQMDEDSEKRKLAITKLESLKESGTKALQALHAKNIVHNDPHGRNLLLSQELHGERLVITDFDCAGDFRADPGRGQRKEWEDWALFRGAFNV